MAHRMLILLFLFLLTHEILSLQNKLRERVAELKHRYRGLYGEVTGREIKRWNSHTETRLGYPGRDKQKLSQIYRLWCEYYECLAGLVGQLTSSGHLPSAVLMVYSGGVARISCGLCVAPGEWNELLWTYAQSTRNLTFSPMVEKDRAVREEDGNITIYHVSPEDAGVYRCQIGSSVGGMVVLEVVDDEELFTVVKPSSSQGPFASPPLILNQSLIIFESWSSWSECSVCGRVGRRRRYGVCYIKLRKPQLYSKHKSSNAEKDKQDHTLNNATIKLFQEFPKGIPCRSQHLPRDIRRLPTVAERRSEVMMAMCKVPCKDDIFELRSDKGHVLERANNSAGIYCLSQALPKQPPVPVREIIFADYGAPVAIRCPGSTLRDVPVSWRVGTKHVVARELARASAGRARLNARDHLVFTAALYGDAHLYSCWEGPHLAGTVKLVVWEGAHIRCSRRGALAALALYGANRLLRYKRYA